MGTRFREKREKEEGLTNGERKKEEETDDWGRKRERRRERERGTRKMHATILLGTLLESCLNQCRGARYAERDAKEVERRDRASQWMILSLWRESDHLLRGLLNRKLLECPSKVVGSHALGQIPLVQFLKLALCLQALEKRQL